MTWTNIKAELEKSKFGSVPPPTDEIAERVEFVLDAAQHLESGKFKIEELAKLVGGEDVWVTRRYLSFSDPLNPVFNRFVDALVHYRAELKGDVITNQGIILREDIEEAMGRESISEDGRRTVEFPIAIPWMRPPVIKENGSVVDCGERGMPLYGKNNAKRPTEKPALKFWRPTSLLDDGGGV